MCQEQCYRMVMGGWNRLSANSNHGPGRWTSLSLPPSLPPFLPSFVLSSLPLGINWLVQDMPQSQTWQMQAQVTEPTSPRSPAECGESGVMGVPGETNMRSLFWCGPQSSVGGSSETSQYLSSCRCLCPVPGPLTSRAEGLSPTDLAPLACSWVLSTQ